MTGICMSMAMRSNCRSDSSRSAIAPSEATATLDPKAYGMSPFFVAPIELIIDAEFAKA